MAVCLISAVSLDAVLLTGAEIKIGPNLSLAQAAWPLDAGTTWIYQGTAKWTAAGNVQTKTLWWTNEVEWAASTERRHIAVVRGSLHLLNFDEPEPTNELTVFVAERNQIYEIHSEKAATAYSLAHRLLDHDDPLPANAQEELNLPLQAGKDFGVDTNDPPRDDHWYCWHVENVEKKPLAIRGIDPDAKHEVATLVYRTNPDHQIVEFASGVGITRLEAAHHGTVGEIKMKLVEFRGLPTNNKGLQVSEVTLFGDMECLRIETPSATYFYGKRGAGFASIIDPAGHDWISYRHGGKALGEYRGLPKCGQPVKYFHCGYGFGQYTNDNPFTITVTERSPEHIRIHSRTSRGDAECDWDFFPSYATLTLLKIPGRYWFIYEGTPGGRLDPVEDFVIRADGNRTPLTQPWVDNVPWMLFGAKETPSGLLCFAHQLSPPVSYVSWPYKPEPDGGLNQMTVTGFGRPGWQDPSQHTPPLNQLPAKFSIAITSQATSNAVGAVLKQIQTPLSGR